MKRLLFLFIITMAIAGSSTAQSAANTYSVKFSTAILTRWPASASPVHNINDMTGKAWEYSNSIILHGIEKVYNNVTDSTRYLNYIQAYVDAYVNSSGAITGTAQTLDKIHPGILCLFLYEKTGLLKYKTAATTLKNMIVGASATYPKNALGGLWHKGPSTNTTYDNVMMLDGIYMAHPFLVKYGRMFGDNACYDTAVNQTLLLYSHLYDNTTHLIKHAWHQPHSKAWADATTGNSSEVWSRAMGWFVMGVVDMLKYLPASHPKYNQVKAMLVNLAVGIQNYQDPSTGLWYQVVDKGGSAGNFIETSGSSMFIYALKIGVDSGWINPSYLAVAQAGWTGLKNATYIGTAGDGKPKINDFAPAMSVMNDYSGYVGIGSVDCPTTTNPHGYAAVLMAASVMEFPIVALPVHFTFFTATLVNNSVQLKWKNPDDDHEVDYYNVQRSANGVDFTTIGKLPATGAAYYNWTDNNISGNTIYYRIQAITTSGAVHYSTVRVVRLKHGEAAMQIAPNPIKDGVVKISFKDVDPDEYTLTILNNIGATVIVKKIQVAGDGIVQAIPLPANIRHGMYYVKLQGTGVTITRCVLVD